MRGFTRVLKILLLALLPAFGQDLTHEAQGSLSQEREQDYRIGPADVLAIGVLGIKEFSSVAQPGLTVTVSNSGKIHLPYLGTMTVNNTTVSQLKSEIARRLREQDLIREPQVQVQVTEYRAHNVYIIGEVMQGGQFMLRHEMHLRDLIAVAKNLDSDVNSIIYVYRRRPVRSESGGTVPVNNSATSDSTLNEVVKINVDELMNGTRPELNLEMQGGDIVYCPMQAPERFYVVGDVNSPGVIALPKRSEGGLLGSQALSLAGGPTRTAKLNKGLVIRFNEDGTRQELAFDFNAIIQGKKPDFAVKPNDVIYIPGSQAKTLGYGFLGIVPSIASTALIF
jgi:polysaccharide biosynthesis/export protein